MANSVSTGVFGKAKSRQVVYANTAALTLTAENFARGPVHINNVGATGSVTVSLPSAVVGMELWAFVYAVQQLRLDPNGTETIALPSTAVQGAAGKYLVADALGEWVHLVCHVAGTWDVLGYSGTWTAEA